MVMPNSAVETTGMWPLQEVFYIHVRISSTYYWWRLQLMIRHSSAKILLHVCFSISLVSHFHLTIIHQYLVIKKSISQRNSNPESDYSNPKHTWKITRCISATRPASYSMAGLSSIIWNWSRHSWMLILMRWVKPTYVTARYWQPIQVLTLIFTNPEGLSITDIWAPAFKTSGIADLAFIPPSLPVKQSAWPTLGQMIDSKKRVVIFLDSGADTTKVPFILPEFDVRIIITGFVLIGWPVMKRWSGRRHSQSPIPSSLAKLIVSQDLYHRKIICIWWGKFKCISPRLYSSHDPDKPFTQQKHFAFRRRSTRFWSYTCKNHKRNPFVRLSSSSCFKIQILTGIIWIVYWLTRTDALL